MKFYQLIFLGTLIIGTTIAISASSWFTCWLGLEINLISLIPLLLNKISPASTEAAIKYFLVQAMASLILVFTSLLERVYSFSNFIETINGVIFLTLLLKAGIPPFHFWFPQVIKASSWFQCVLILTWQKIAPFILIRYLFYSNLVSLAILASCLVGPLGGLNQTNFIIIITYSSVTHRAWITAIIFWALSVWTRYFTIYSLITVSVILIITRIKLESLKQISLSKVKIISSLVMVSLLLRLGGLPPLLGFIPKLSAIQTLLSIKIQGIAVILIVASLVSLFYYIRVIYSSLINKHPQLNFKLLPMPKQNNLITTIAATGNIASPVLVCLT